jgi:hypothetical protein
MDAVDPPAWTVQVDPLTTALGFVHLQIERALTPSVSIYAGPHLRLFDAIGSQVHQPYVGLGGEVGVRWFPWHAAPTGFWLLGRGVLADLFTTDGSHQHAVGGYGSALVGYTGLIGGRLVLSGGLGVQRLQYTVGDYGIEGFAPAAHTAIGVAF